MFLLYNNRKYYLHFLIGVILILFQGLMPKIHLTDNLVISLDVFLIYLTFLALIVGILLDFKIVNI